MCCHSLFFFKQKTAYEVRISDWSSDVCSSDLETARHNQRLQSVDPIGRTGLVKLPRASRVHVENGVRCVPPQDRVIAVTQFPGEQRGLEGVNGRGHVAVALPPLDQGKLDAFAVENDLQVVNCPSVVSAAPQVKLRSEEHTSELQSLMRNSYA